MRKPFAFGILFCVMLPAVQANDLPRATPAKVGLSAERLTRIDEHFRKLVEQGEISGALTLVGRRGQVAHLQTYGWMDVEARRPMREDALFRIASMTKAVTSVALLQLMERGQFRLDEPVSRYIPAMARDKLKVVAPDKNGTVELAREVTIRDLFRHTSGLYYTGDAYTKAGLPKWQASLPEFVDRLASIPLAAQPGATFRYGFSTDVLGLLLERLSGMPMDRYFEENVFAPLDLRDTGFVVPASKVARLPNHYEWKNGRLVCDDAAATSPFLKRAPGLSAGGGWDYSYPGLVTTARDWWRFLEMLRNHGRLGGRRILSRKSVELMCADHLGAIPGFFSPGAGFGLGVGVVTDSVRHGQLASNGTIYWAGGPHNTYFFVDFQEELVGILMVQSGPFSHRDMMSRFLTLAHQAIDD